MKRDISRSLTEAQIDNYKETTAMIKKLQEHIENEIEDIPEGFAMMEAIYDSIYHSLECLMALDMENLNYWEDRQQEEKNMMK